MIKQTREARMKRYSKKRSVSRSLKMGSSDSSLTLFNSFQNVTEEEASRLPSPGLQVDVERHEVCHEAQPEGAEEEAEGVGGSYEGY